MKMIGNLLLRKFCFLGRVMMLVISKSTHTKPKIRLNASTTKKLITWKEVHEPVFSCHLNIDELKKLRESPLKVPDYSVQAQSCEQAVDQLSAASKTNDINTDRCCAFYAISWVRALSSHDTSLRSVMRHHPRRLRHWLCGNFRTHFFYKKDKFF